MPFSPGHTPTARMAVAAMHRQQPAQSERRPPLMTSETLVHRYLNPVAEATCPHGDPDCLCDVDVSKTAGMTFDNVPAIFNNVETADDLTVVAANIWARKDVLGDDYMWIYAIGEGLDSETDEEWQAVCDRMAPMMARVAEGASLPMLKDEGFEVNQKQYQFMRRATDTSRTKVRRLAVVKAEKRALELHADGLTTKQIQAALVEEGMSLQVKTLYKLYKRNRLRPNGQANNWKPSAVA